MEAFIADAMLGRLARWLRFLGYDVLYCRDIEDREIVRTARQTGRILLTRDRDIVRDFSVHHLLIRSEHLKEQLAEVLREYPPGNRSSRCMRCNGQLEEVREKEELVNEVPEHLFHSVDSFQRCQACGSIYWKGSHYSRMLKSVREILI
jgi:hypothetical protein